MRIGILCYPTFGGSGIVATELGKALAEKGHQVHFISYSQPVRLQFFSENLFYHEVNVPDYPLFDYLPYELALTSKLVDVIKYERLELLHVHYAIPHAYAAFMAKQILAGENFRLPVVTTLHGTDITLVGRNPNYKPAVTFSINQSDVVTSVSESLKKDTYDFFSVSRDIEVIPNFIDFDFYQIPEEDEALKRSIAPNGERIISHVSNFRPVKRVGDVIAVFDRIRKEMPAKLLMIGDGPDREKVSLQARELGICDDIRFLGKSKSIEKLLAVSDLFLLPSETESFGLAALEAMAAKVPVISTDTGGLPEVNIHGQTGYLSKVGDIEDMAKNAVKILSDEGVLNEFKENALLRAREFSIDKVLPLYEAIYQRLYNTFHNAK